MLGLMQDHPLLIWTLIEHAARNHAEGEIVSRRVEGDLHRYTYADAARRARQVANALDRMGIAPGDRVGTLAWNGHRHFELYYGVSGSRRVIHTINPRLIGEQIAWIVNHAENRALFFDLTFLPIVRALVPHCPTVQRWIALCDAKDLPADAGIPNLVAYETWIGAEPDTYDWPVFDENEASNLCYTSGTTGHPKGVLYSHRSTLLHAFAASMPDGLGASASDVILPVVPMFHVNAWGLPYAAAMSGAKLVFPGPALDGKSVYDLIDSEGVTMAAGVPTVWIGLLGHVKANGLAFRTMRRTVIGGSAAPPAMIQAFREYDVSVVHAWGMTETSPLGTVCRLKNRQLAQPPEQQMATLVKQGRALYGVEMKIVGADGAEVPWDGRTPGDLLVRGPWIVRSYFRNEGPSPLRDGGWFPTGDVAVIDPDGFMQITDRTKDLIKSGGEWISSIDVENIAMAHPQIAMAACIGVPHPKWDERPLLVVVRKPDSTLTREELLAFFDGRIAKWQVPDDVVFVESIPIGATGKMQKMTLREQFAGHVLPG